VPESAYNGLAYTGGSTADTYATIQAHSLTFTPYGSTTPITQVLRNPTIQELFDPEGRMNATLGVELPFTGALIQTTVPLGFTDPTTETLVGGKTQLWKITHNGVDTHGIHFHLVNVQVINRVGWDGAIRPPDDNEMGWKDTVRMNPLEDIIVAMRAKVPTFPFAVPDSIRPLAPALPVGATMPSLDPFTGQPITITNDITNFGNEYTWHCHILGHEENDMMRPLVLKVNDRIGVFRGNGEWYLDSNGNGAYNVGIDKVLVMGTSGDIPVSGDWDGSGPTSMGVFNNGTWTLISNGTTITHSFGIPGDTPVTGDWDGNGSTRIGVARNQGGALVWYLDMNGNGVWDQGIDRVTSFGIAGDKPVTGDWNGTGTTKIGIVRNSYQWYLDASGNGVWGAGDVQYTFGMPGDTPVTGDWNGDGRTEIGIFRSGHQWYLDMNGNGAWNNGVDVIYSFGIPGDKLVTGKW